MLNGFTLSAYYGQCPFIPPPSFNSSDRVLLIIQRYDVEMKQIYAKIVAKV